MGGAYNALTDDEKEYVKSHPVNAYNIWQARETSERETFHRFGYNGHNDASDAFRHCYWSALLARDIGEVEAKRFTDFHESSPFNPPLEKEMDTHNNEVGIEIGKHGGSDMDLADKCYNALTGGRLKRIK